MVGMCALVLFGRSLALGLFVLMAYNLWAEPHGGETHRGSTGQD